MRTARIRELWGQTREFVYKHVLHADDTPHRIALGAALGMFVALTPTLGFQMAITLALATLFRANKVVGLPLVWLTNPVTAVPVYAPCWQLGHALLRSSAKPDGTAHLQAMVDALVGHTGQGIWSRLFEAEFWLRLLRIMLDFGLELWVGCLVVASVAGIITYFVTRWGVTEYRQRRRVRMIRRNTHRARLRKAKHHRRTALCAAPAPTSSVP